MKKEFENIFKKIKHEDKDFSSHQRDWENFEQNKEPVAPNVLFYHKIVKKEHFYINQNITIIEKIMCFC